MPSHIRIGGAQSTAGAPDTSIAFTVSVRDFVNAPVAGATVDVHLGNCTDLRVCTAVVAGQQVVCSFPLVRGITDAAGDVTLRILGAGINAGTVVPPAIAPGAGAGCAQIYADGVLLAAITAVIYDANGALAGGNGVNGLDFAIAKNDVGAVGLGAPYRGRSDFRWDGSLNGADLAVLREIVGRSGLGMGSGAGCAGGGAAQPYCP